MSALLTQSPGDTLQTGTGKVDPAHKFKRTTTARDILLKNLKSSDFRLFTRTSSLLRPLRPFRSRKIPLGGSDIFGRGKGEEGVPEIQAPNML